jgi:hypothetical protein
MFGWGGERRLRYRRGNRLILLRREHVYDRLRGAQQDILHGRRDWPLSHYHVLIREMCRSLHQRLGPAILSAVTVSGWSRQGFKRRPQ